MTLAMQAEARLIAPLLPHLGDGRTLFLSPDGPLQALPFEALADTAASAWSSASTSGCCRPAAIWWPVTDRRSARGSSPSAASTSARGRPAPRPSAELAAADAAAAAIAETRSQIGGFGALPESGAEASHIAEAYAVFRPDEPAPVLLLGSDATEGALKGLAAPPRVLHLATHGYYLATGSIDGQPLLQSGVTLAGANRALAGGTGPTARTACCMRSRRRR